MKTSLDISEQSFQLAEQVDDLREAAQSVAGCERSMFIEAVREARQALDEAAIIAGNWLVAQRNETELVLNALQVVGDEPLVVQSEVAPAYFLASHDGNETLLRIDDDCQDCEPSVTIVRRFIK